MTRLAIIRFDRPGSEPEFDCLHIVCPESRDEYFFVREGAFEVVEPMHKHCVVVDRTGCMA